MTVHDGQADPMLKANFPEFYPDIHGACAFIRAHRLVCLSVSLRGVLSLFICRGRRGACVMLLRVRGLCRICYARGACVVSGIISRTPNPLIDLNLEPHETHTHTDRALSDFHRRMAADPTDIAQRFKVRKHRGMNGGTDGCFWEERDFTCLLATHPDPNNDHRLIVYRDLTHACNPPVPTTMTIRCPW